MIIDRDSQLGFAQDHWADEPQGELHGTTQPGHGRRARGPLWPAAGHDSAHRPDRRRQDDDRLCAGAAAVRGRPGGLRARRPEHAAGISRDLGFTAGERSENLRRSAEVARLMNDAGLISICAFLAPDEDVRPEGPRRIGADRFFEVYLSAPRRSLPPARHRGHVRQGRCRRDRRFSRRSAPYDVPRNRRTWCSQTDQLPVDACVDKIVRIACRAAG